MIYCPACGESRWVYPRRHPLGGVSKHLAGWSAYRCRACEWRGWGRVPDSDRAPVRLLYKHACEYAASGLQRVAALLARPRVAAWLVASIAIALVTAGVRFSVAKPSSQPIESAATQPVEAAPSVQEPVVPEPPSVQTAVEQLTVPDLRRGHCARRTAARRTDCGTSPHRRRCHSRARRSGISRISRDQLGAGGRCRDGGWPVHRQHAGRVERRARGLTRRAHPVVRLRSVVGRHASRRRQGDARQRHVAARISVASGFRPEAPPSAGSSAFSRKLRLQPEARPNPDREL